MFAAENGEVEILRLLLNAEANIDAMDDEQITTLMRAIVKGQVKSAKLLHDRGASVNIRNKDVWSALMLAANIREILLCVSSLSVASFGRGCIFASRKGSRR